MPGTPQPSGLPLMEEMYLELEVLMDAWHRRGIPTDEIGGWLLGIAVGMLCEERVALETVLAFVTRAWPAVPTN